MKDSPKSARAERRAGSPPDLRAIETFLAICDTGGVSAAARRIGLTQPAVSQVVRRLEQDLGVRLFDRQQRPVRLTSAGEALEQRGRELLAEAQQLAATVRESASAKLVIVRAGLIDSFAATAGPSLVKALGGFAEHMSVWSGISPTLVTDFRNRTIDLMVTSDPLEDVDGLERHLLLTESFVLVVPAQFAARYPKPTLEMLAESLPLIRYSARSVIGAQIERHLRRLRIKTPRRLEFDATEAVFAMVSAGLGWAVTTPLCLLQGRASAGNLRPLPMPGPAFSRSLFLITREGQFSRISRTCADAARESLGRLLSDLQSAGPWIRKRFVIGGQRTSW